MRRVASMAAPRRFDYMLAPFGKKDMPTRATWDVGYRDVESAAADRFPRDAGAAARRHASRAAIISNGSSASGRRSAAAGEVTATAPPGVAHDDARVPARRARGRRRRCRRRRARSTRARRSATCRSPGTSPTRSIRNGSRSVRAGSATPKTYVEFAGPHRIRRAIADPVSRHQPRLARKRSRARGDHDRRSARRPAPCRSAARASSTA